MLYVDARSLPSGGWWAADSGTACRAVQQQPAAERAADADKESGTTSAETKGQLLAVDSSFFWSTFLQVSVFETSRKDSIGVTALTARPTRSAAQRPSA